MTSSHDPWYVHHVQLDVESLRTFLAVLDRGGMTRAAEFLGQSQSSVSWRIKRLEQKVGRPLLIRDGHTLRPSRDGRELLDDARMIVDLHDRAVARLSSSELSGQVRLGANSEIGAERMAALLGRFRREHPGATIEFTLNQTEHLIGLVNRGAIDVAVIQVTDEGLEEDDVLLWTSQLHWVTSPEAPYSEGPVPLVTYGEHCFYRPLSEPILDAHGVEHDLALAVPSASGVRAAIAAGLGVGVLARRYLDDEIVEWQRGAALGPLPRVHQIARPVPGERPEVASVLLDALVTELREQPNAA